MGRWIFADVTVNLAIDRPLCPRPHTQQSVEKSKMTADAAAAEAKAVEGRITYSLDLKDLKDADLVIEVRCVRVGLGPSLGLLPAAWIGTWDSSRQTTAAPKPIKTKRPNDRPSWRTWT